MQGSTPEGFGARSRPDGFGARVTAIAVLLTVAFFALASGVAKAGYGPPRFGTPIVVDSQAPFRESTAVARIVCPTASRCIAIDTDPQLTDNFDSETPTWRRSTSAFTTRQIGLACLSESTCLDLTSNMRVRRSTDGGATWTDPVATSASGTGVGFSCSSAGLCLGAITTGLTTRSADGGATWKTGGTVTLSGLGTTVQLRAVSCIGAATCVAVDNKGGVAVSTNQDATGTPTWTRRQVDGATASAGVQISDVSCQADQRCIAVDNAGNVVRIDLTADFTTWTVVPTGIEGALTGVWCSAAWTCVTVSANGATAVSANAFAESPSWATVATTDATPLRSVACREAGGAAVRCVAGGDQGLVRHATIDVSTPGDWSWGAPTTLNGINPLLTASCADGGVCVGLESTFAAVLSTDGGATWHPRVDPVGSQRPAEVACVDAGGGTCIALENVGRTAYIAHDLTTKPLAWTAVQISRPADGGFPGDGALLRISCAPDGAVCMAVTNLGTALVAHDVGGDGALTWSPSVTGGGAAAGVSCPSASVCVVVSEDGNAYRTRNVDDPAGPAWSGGIAIPKTDPTARPVAVACTARFVCAVSNNRGEVRVTEDIRAAEPEWSAPQAVSSGLLRGACVGTSLCVFLGGSTSMDLWSGNPQLADAWSGQTLPINPKATSGYVRDVTCTRKAECLAIDSTGQAFRATAPASELTAPERLAFPDTIAGETITRTLTLSNPGAASASIFGVALEGSDAVGYQVVDDACSEKVVGPGGTCTVTVRFAPTEIGAYGLASLRISSDDERTPQTVTLDGAGIAPPPPPGDDGDPPANPQPSPPAGQPAPPISPQDTSPTGRVTLTRKLGRHGAFTLTAKTPAAGKVRVTLTTKVKDGKRTRTISYRAVLSRTVTRAGTVRFTIKPSGKAAAALRKAGRLRVTIKVRYTPRSGAARTTTATVTVKR